MSGRLRRWLANSDLLLRLSAVFTLIALALMLWSMVVPTVWPVMIAMSAGQALGTLALVLFLSVVIRDVRRARRPDGDA